MRKFFFILLLSFSYTQAQEEEQEEIKHAKSKGYNPDYRVNYFDKIIFQLGINSDVNNFYIPKLSDNNNLKSSFVPNDKLKLKFSLDYKFLGIYFSVSPDFLPGNNQNPEKGQTRTLDLSFKFFYSDRWRQEVTYKTIKGFYLENYEPVAIFQDLQIMTIGGKTLFIQNKNFSYRAYETMTERQIKSNGSVIPSVSYFYNDLQTNKKNESQVNLSHIQSYDVNFKLGYMYNFILFKKWFSTIGVHPGIGLSKANVYYYNPITNNDKENTIFDINYNVDGNFGIGYNNKNFFSGVRANYKNLKYGGTNSAQIMNTKTTFGIFLGYRFDQTKRMKKIFDNIEKRIGI